MAATIVDTVSSTAFLADGQKLRRLPLHPERTRPAEFLAAFEDRALVYDCFWHQDGQRVLMVGPAPSTLWPHYRAAVYRAGQTVLKARHHRTLSVTITELGGVPAGATSVTMTLGGEHHLPIRPSLVPDFAGRRLLFSINKDNDLSWIAEWARYHAAIHGTDAVVLFDNGSTRYAVAEIAATLAAVPGIARVAVPSWPHKFGPVDRAQKSDPYWPLFLQIASMSVALHRFGRAAHGMLNCDIDELASPAPPSLYEAVAGSFGGYLTFKGQWVEALAEGDAPAHRGFRRRLIDAEARRSRPSKWIIDPRRAWFDRLDVHPYWHWIANRPLLAKRRLPDAHYWHFKGINTNWKLDRTAAPDPAATEPDAALIAAFAAMTP